MLTDLRELKAILEIDPDNTAEDAKLLFLAEWASDWIEELLNRKNRLFFKSRTEYYGGSGTQQLLLRARPVFTTPTIQVYSDDTGYFGSNPDGFNASTLLTYGDDYCLVIDQDDGSSRSGILVRMQGYWFKPSVRQKGLLTPFIGNAYGNIKVVYTAGYTIDNLPSQLRAATNFLIARMRAILPLGMEVASESYEERSISLIAERRDYLLAIIKPMIYSYRNWSW